MIPVRALRPFPLSMRKYVPPYDFSALCATLSRRFLFCLPRFSPESFTSFPSRSRRVLEDRSWPGSESRTCAGSGIKLRWAICHYGPGFWASRQIPSSVTLRLRCSSEDTSIHNDCHLFPVVSAYLQGPSHVEFKTLRATFSDRDRSLDVTASTSLPTPGSHRTDDEFVLSFDWLPEFGNWTLLEQTCKMLPISNLEFLFIQVSAGIVNPVNWVELFKCCTKVTTLQATGCRTSGLVRALTTPRVTNTWRGWKGKKTRRDNSDDTSAQPARSTVSCAQAAIFPNLKSLSLKNLDFAERVYSSGILFNVVKKGLRQRKAAYNTPLKMLRIDDCAISAERAKALQGLVQTLHWDGNESFLDKSEGFCHRSVDSDESA